MNRSRASLFLLLLIAMPIIMPGVWASELSSLFAPLPKNPEYDHARALLGKRLFSDPSLSASGSQACAGCHNLLEGGADGLVFSFNSTGQIRKQHTPTVLNARYNLAQLWSGKADSLGRQVHFHLTGESKRGLDLKKMLQRLTNDPTYAEAFRTAYGDNEATIERIADAIEEFEKALVTPSRFDRYLQGDKSALNAAEKRGLELFQTKGCVACHNGIYNVPTKKHQSKTKLYS